MGLISRVSSRTYRSSDTKTIIMYKNDDLQGNKGKNLRVTIKEPSYVGETMAFNDQTDNEKSRSRREAHTLAEKRRRDSINKGYDELQKVVPTVTGDTDPNTGQKVSKFQILLRSIDYLEFLQEQTKLQEAEYQTLIRKLNGMEMIKASYEKIHRMQAPRQQEHGYDNVNRDEIKRQVLQWLAKLMFESFEKYVTCDHFEEYCGTVFPWLESHCAPGDLLALAEIAVKEVCDLESKNNQHQQQQHQQQHQQQ